MAIIKESRLDKIEIDIRGPDGNAWALMGHASRYGKQLGLTKEEISAITTEMMAGDYQHLLEVFDENFGDYIDLVTNEGEDEDDEDSY